MYKRQDCSVIGTKVSAEAEMNPRRRTIKNIRAKILSSQTDNLFIFLCKKSYQRAGTKLTNQGLPCESR